nr:MAG TPA: hypothetical protein [Bacteriophage sp.]
MWNNKKYLSHYYGTITIRLAFHIQERGYYL